MERLDGLVHRGTHDSYAIFSSCETYRYELGRIWDKTKPVVTFCLLNPSTADENELDPTLRRCKGYAQRWGHGGMVIVNAFALRSTDPSGLKQVADPVGPKNDFFIEANAKSSDLFVVGWGTHAGSRQDAVRSLVGQKAVCLGVNGNGSPKHPLYLKADLEPVPWPSSP